MMNKKKSVLLTYIIIGLILIVGTYFITSYMNTKEINLIQEKHKNEMGSLHESNLQFLKEYSIALNNIHMSIALLDLAIVNKDNVISYTDSNGQGYIYETAKSIINLGKDQSMDAQDYLTKAKIRLEGIKDKAPNDFFKEDISNRLEQIDLLLVFATQTYSLLDYTSQQLYEINYGTETKATEYYNKYNDLIPRYNSNLKKLSDIQNKIDLQWDQDWYPTFQESSR